MILGVHHVGISTPDIARLLDFYCNHLGFEVVVNDGWNRGTEGADTILGVRDTECVMAMIRLGNVFLEVFQFSHPEPRPNDSGYSPVDHGISHFCLAVRDIEGEYHRLLAAGATFNAPPRKRTSSSRTMVAYGRDPDGNIFELLEFLGETPVSLNYSP